MAYAHQAYFGVIDIRDNAYTLTRVRVQLQGATIGAAGSALADFVAKLDAVTQGWVEKYYLEDVYTTDQLFTANLPHGLASEKALLTMQLTVPGKTASFALPAPLGVEGVSRGIFKAASGTGWNEVDPTVTVISDFMNTFAAGGDAFISDGENTITGPFIKGKRITRRSTNP